MYLTKHVTKDRTSDKGTFALSQKGYAHQLESMAKEYLISCFLTNMNESVYFSAWAIDG